MLLCVEGMHRLMRLEYRIQNVKGQRTTLWELGRLIEEVVPDGFRSAVRHVR